MGRTFKRWWMVQKGWWPDSGMEVGRSSSYASTSPKE